MAYFIDRKAGAVLKGMPPEKTSLKYEEVDEETFEAFEDELHVREHDLMEALDKENAEAYAKQVVEKEEALDDLVKAIGVDRSKVAVLFGIKAKKETGEPEARA